MANLKAIATGSVRQNPQDHARPCVWWAQPRSGGQEQGAALRPFRRSLWHACWENPSRGFASRMSSNTPALGTGATLRHITLVGGECRSRLCRRLSIATSSSGTRTAFRRAQNQASRLDWSWIGRQGATAISRNRSLPILLPPFTAWSKVAEPSTRGRKMV